MLALTLDIMIVFLLLVSLGAGLRLYSALKIFRVDSNEFQPMISSLDQATVRAESALGGLRKMAENVGTKLNDETKNTQRLLDELDFMTQRADQLAEKLDERIGQARSAEQNAASIASTTGIDFDDDDDVVTLSSPIRRHAPDLEQRLKNLR